MGDMEELSDGVGDLSGSPGLGFGESFRTGQSSSVGVGNTFLNFPRKILRVLCGYFEHQRRVEFGMSGGATPHHHDHSLWVKVELPAIAHCFAGRTE